MTYLYSYEPGQICLPVKNDATNNPVSTLNWYPGQLFRLEGWQHNYSLLAKHDHTPFPYLPDSHTDTVWGNLDNNLWLRGIVLDMDWGRIETAPGVWDWRFYDKCFEIVRNLKKTTGKDKKIWLLINLRHIKLTEVETFLPADLLTMPANVNVANVDNKGNKSYHKDTNAYPMTADPLENAPKYDHMWCFAGTVNGQVGDRFAKGYNWSTYQFRNSETNTLKTRFYAFLDALADKYGDDDVLGGFIATESAIGVPLSTIVGSTTTTWEGENNRDTNYQGRLDLMKHIKSIFPNKVVSECGNHDAKYSQQLTAAGATNGLIAHKLAFSTANMHTGTNLNLGNIRSVMAGQVPVVMQAQPLDIYSMTGNRETWFQWTPTPSDGYGSPDTTTGTGYTKTIYDDPPTAEWLWERFRYFKANFFIYQRNTGTGGTANNASGIHWKDWIVFMNAAASRRDDPYGGCISTKPNVPG